MTSQFLFPETTLCLFHFLSSFFPQSKLNNLDWLNLFNCVLLLTPWGYLLLSSIKVHAPGSPHASWSLQVISSWAHISQHTGLANIHWKYKYIEKRMNQISEFRVFSNKIECFGIWTQIGSENWSTHWLWVLVRTFLETDI